jgi:ADP-ribose pyrophosphatase
MSPTLAKEQPVSPDYAHLRERGLTQEIVFKGHLLRIRVDTVALPNGEIANREIVEHPGAVAVVAVADGQVLMVRQFRYAIGQLSLELPAGCLDQAGEAVEAAAARELSEETGHDAARLIYLGRIHSSPGFSNEVTHLLAAEGLQQAREAHTDADEFVDLVHVPLVDALAMIQRGEITDAKTIAGLLWYQQFGLTTHQSPPRKGTLDEDEAS